ncbi:TadE/TadG family type IV pilus assembly protein [Massilia sp. YIM B02443]|uniref:TadE/TadG family type IV pilus assembly protein n=1 Tax=Massilia sp. YIM B02443 TaxID=3050127 RepID=UPI0025B6EB84|nr:TadE/TadG family type IV pilus assembly protein [Massilia sp. YIM B02443]MDN4038177.1 TadE/TadG family type IV pilus assembly protein [Massilia sp. YIM B02443]
MQLYPNRKRQRGVAAVEAALLLPILMLLLFGMIDAARALQANIIMTNIGREGANLVARSNTDLDTGSQDLIFALMSSAPPLDVNNQAMVYITRVMGVASNGATRSVVLDQYRWDDAARALGVRKSGYRPVSKVYNCGSWSATTAKCTAFTSSNRPTVAVMSGKLDDGEVVYVVETFYRYDMLFSGFASGSLSLQDFGPDLYSFTVF